MIKYCILKGVISSMQNYLDVKGKNAIVTGASSGLGR